MVTCVIHLGNDELINTVIFHTACMTLTCAAQVEHFNT